MPTHEYTDECAEALRLVRLIREEPAWALSRVQRAAELEAEVERLREENRVLRSVVEPLRSHASFAAEGCRCAKGFCVVHDL